VQAVVSSGAHGAAQSALGGHGPGSRGTQVQVQHLRPMHATGEYNDAISDARECALQAGYTVLLLGSQKTCCAATNLWIGMTT
jgi:hypothetical protein